MYSTSLRSGDVILGTDKGTPVGDTIKKAEAETERKVDLLQS